MPGAEDPVLFLEKRERERERGERRKKRARNTREKREREKRHKPDEAEGQAVPLDLPRRGGAVLPPFTIVVEAPVLEVGVLEGVAARPGEGEDPAEVAELVAVFFFFFFFFRELKKLRFRFELLLQSLALVLEFASSESAREGDAMRRKERQRNEAKESK